MRLAVTLTKLISALMSLGSRENLVFQLLVKNLKPLCKSIS